MRLALVPAFVLGAALPAAAQQGADVDKAKVDLAVRKAIGYLKSQNGSHLTAFDAEKRRVSLRELVLYTYATWGMDERDADFKQLFDDMIKDKLEETHCVALQAMALEEYDRVKYQKRIAQCAKFLVDNQIYTGYWSLGSPSIYVEDFDTGKNSAASAPAPAAGAKDQPGLRVKPTVKNRIKIRKDRDGEGPVIFSATQYATLGLRAAHDAGIVIPGNVTDSAMKCIRDYQKRENVGGENLVESAPVGGVKIVAPQGWCCGNHPEHKAYGSMTAAMTESLAIWDYIKDNDDGKKKSWKKDTDVHEGLQWLAKNFSVTYNPGPFEHAKMEENSRQEYLYYLHALSGVGLTYGTEVLGTHRWYAEGAKELLNSQNQMGGWGLNSGDTCFAILFLMRATRWLSPGP